MEKETIVYKLTRPDMTTYDRFQWEQGREYTFPGTGLLCSSGWAHAYTSPALALFLNPIHANYNPFRLWRAKGVIGATDQGLKVGCSRLTLVSEIVNVPDVTMEQRVMFGIYCTLAVETNSDFKRWALSWLNRKDRTEKSARAAAYAAQAAAYAAVNAAKAAAYAAAYAAADAANAAAYAAADAANAAAYAAANAAIFVNLDSIASSILLPWEGR